MAKDQEALKKLIAEGATETIGQLWSSEQDRAFLLYNAEKIAKYAIKLKKGSAAEVKEARFNLDMIQASLAAYFHQKQLIAEKSVEHIAMQVAALAIKLAIAAVPA